MVSKKQINLVGAEVLDKTILDDVYTPEPLAKEIIKMFSPSGVILEPCRGKGAFYRNLPDGSDWCEIEEGRDFFNYTKKVDWIITNPPYSNYDRFLDHSFEIADNIVFLVPLGKVFNSWERIEKLRRWGGVKKIWVIGTGNKAGFPSGFPVGAFHFQKGYHGLIEMI